jgi:FMN reductase
MRKTHIVSFTGSPQRPSKTRLLAGMVSSRVAERIDCVRTEYDLLDLGPALGSFSRNGLQQDSEAILRSIETADALIVGSPVYKGSYAGQFKHIFDLLDPLALVGKPVAIVATGGGHRHALVVEHQLRPLFGFFSAMTMPTAIYASTEDFCDGCFVDKSVLSRVESAALELEASLRGQEATRAANQVEMKLCG